MTMTVEWQKHGSKRVISHDLAELNRSKASPQVPVPHSFHFKMSRLNPTVALWIPDVQLLRWLKFHSWL